MSALSEMLKTTVLIGLLIGMSAAYAEEQIRFAPKAFGFSPDAEAIEVSGTLTGEGVPYPNNTQVITCWKGRKECTVISVVAPGERFRIGPPGFYIDRVTGPGFYPIISWTDNEVVAQEEEECSRTTIRITRKSSTVLWVQEPINQTQTWCAKSETRVLKWTIENPAYYKGIFGR
jgi:hypothetical protein